MADENKLPEGEIKGKIPFKNDQEFLPNAEYYEAEANNLELLINREKRRINQELLDEFKRLEYVLSQRERALKLKEIELNQREKDIEARERRLAILESQELSPSPKYSGDESELDLSEEDVLEQLEQRDAALSGEKEKKPRDYIPNPAGVGGLPGSAKSTAITIDRGQYQGDIVTLENGNRLVWNKQTKEYEWEFIPSDDERINANRGLKFTYFAVEAAYLNDGYDNPNYGNFYSQTILRKQVWYEKTPSNRNSDGVGEQYQGRVPLDVLIQMLNSSLNTRLFTSNGEFIENQDFRRAYKNWRLKYERGTYYKTSKGELYSIIEPGSQVNESRGNPPAFRTDGNLKSPTYGARVNLSTEEKRKWRGGL